ncbi:MAG: glycosyltransferase [Eubacteriales bacterium]
MKILQTLDCYYPKFDGPTNVITNYGKSLKKVKNAEVDVYVPRFPKYKDDQPFKVVRVKSVRSADGYYQGMPGIDGKLKKTLKENKYDVIHIHSPFTMGRFFARYGKKHGIPTVFTFHTKFKEDFVRILHAKPLVGFMMRYIMTTINACDHVLTVSDGAAEVLRSYGYKKEITVIRNGTDLVYPANAAELAAQVEEKHALAGQKNVFLSVGRIVENKRLDLVLDALKIVKERGVDFRFLVVGDGSYKEKLENKAKDLALADRVIFTGKVMDRALLSGYYLRSDLFMFPSTFDTASLAPIEAAALKLPSLMTRGCSTAEIVTENRNGFLAGDTAESWADEICRIVTDENLLTQAKENCYREVYRTWDDVCGEVYDFYEKAIASK